MSPTPPELGFKRWRLVQNKYNWWLIPLAAVLWPITVAIPYKLVVSQATLATSLLHLLGTFCVLFAAVVWMVLLIVAIYRRYWRFTRSLLVALVVFFTVGAIVGYRL
jgi:hypothetical protein